MKFGFTRTLLTSSIVALSLYACSSEKAPTSQPQPTEPMAPRPVASAEPAPPTGIQIEKELQYDVVPSSAQTAMALTLANQLMIEGKLEEAEARYKVAAAGGNAEAEKMLVKLRTEITAKEHFDSARQKFQYGDYEGAKVALRQIPSSSMLRKSADTLQSKIQEKETAIQKALEASIQQGLHKALDDEGEGMATE